MNIKSYSTPTKKYKTLLSSVHSVWRLINSTFELRELVCRLARMLCQIFNANFCEILLLDHTKEHILFKCVINNKRRTILDKRIKVSQRLEKRIVKNSSVVRKGTLLAIPLVYEDVIGIVILKRKPKHLSLIHI